MTGLDGLRVLVLDDEPPAPQRDGGSLRMLELLKGLGKLGCELVIGHAKRRWDTAPPPIRALAGDEELYAFVQQAEFDAALLSRPAVASRWLEPIRKHAPGALVAYDTVDLHFLREFRGAKRAGSVRWLRVAMKLRERELQLARAADVTLVVSEHERRVLTAECSEARVCVVSNVHPVKPLAQTFPGREGFLFVGGFRHKPNSDAVDFLLSEIWPIVRESDPAAALTIAGGDYPPRLRGKRSPGVTFAGQVSDLEPLLAGSRVMVAPLRFGAGVKGKVLLAMAYGLPVVGTPVALEGIGNGLQALVAEGAVGLAEAMLRLSRDECLWRELRERGLQLVERDFSRAAARRALAAALSPALEGTRA